jgi:branched-chain amino acid transport system permease protein
MLEQQIVNGIIISSIYALAALGLSLIFSTLDVPDFAQGQMYMIGAFVSYFLVVKYNLGLVLSIFVSMAIVALIGICMEMVVYRRARYRSHLVIMLSAFALSIFFENLALLIFGEYIRSIPSVYGKQLFTFWGITISKLRIIVFLVVAVFITSLQIFIMKTKWGKAMRAVSQNKLGAEMVGINLNKIFSFTFAVGSAFGALTGALLGILYNVSPSMGNIPNLKAFVVIVLGGLGNMFGIIIGSFILGMAESLGGAYISSAYTDTIAFGILIVALTIKPKGLLGK